MKDWIIRFWRKVAGDSRVLENENLGIIKKRNSLTISLVGAGGAGVVTIGELIEKIAEKNGYYGRLSKYYDAQIRGGGSAVKVSIQTDPDDPPNDESDILVCFSADKFHEFKEELTITPNTVVFFEEDAVRELFPHSRLIKIPFGELSSQATGTAQSRNLVALGLLLEFFGFFDEIPEDIKKSEKILSDKNLAAVKAGREELRKIDDRILLAPPQEKKDTIIIDGNRAASRGAIRAGCLFGATYPITPASEIGEDLSRELPKESFHEINEDLKEELPKTKGVFVQGESEIAAINMIIDASIVGAKSITATSGPGLDLMVEGINLASSCEIPIVVIDVQRVGPSTGMPTKMEQADLSTAIFSGHGYAPRVVLAPYNTEECYRMAIEAFNISEEYQIPVILLSDQYLGQTSKICDDFTKNEYRIKNRLLPNPDEKGNYKRYKITPNFISPMALPGMEGFEWRATGLTHNEKGDPESSSTEWHQRMQEKITKKLDPLRSRRDLVKIFGPQKSKIGLIAWGSSGEASLGFIRKLGLENKIKVCVPELITPMPKEIVGEFLQDLEKLLVVEMNYSGQYLGFLRRYFNSSAKVDLPKKIYILKRAGGRPWSQKEFEKFISEVL